MAAGILVNIQEEVTCPICLELLTEPLSLDCGHSFCQVCITTNSKEFVIGQGESSCPVCRLSYQPENLRPNRHLANIAERLKEVRLSPEEEQQRDLCVRHGEKLLLFCKEDGKFICWLCERSQEHRSHHTSLVEEVAQEYQEKLQAALERLVKEEQNAEKLGAHIREERTSWKNQVEHEIRSVQNVFKKLRSTLDSMEEKEVQRLKKEEGEALHYLAGAESELVQQSQLVRDLISDLERRLKGSTVEMLQDVINVIRRSESWTLKKPKIVSKKRKSAFRVPDLSGMLQAFKELTEVQSYWVDIMLNPVNSPSNVVISADQKQVTAGHSFVHPCNFDFDVFGCQHFSSGKYYWEVDVSGKTAWILGVCRKTNDHFGKNSSGFVFNRNVNHPQGFSFDPNVKRYSGFGLNPQGNHSPGFSFDPNVKLYTGIPLNPNVNHYSKYRPENGYWVVGLRNKSEYMAFEDDSPSHPKILTLFMAVPPCRVGVFLDYEAGTVSFFNVTNHGSLIYKFSKCQFSQTSYPYFNPWNCPAPMTLCQPIL